MDSIDRIGSFAVVTGAAGGIGSECAMFFARQGWPDPLLCDSDPMLLGAALPRKAHTSEIAAVAAFLCSPGASFITGTDILVDGGALAGMGL